MIDHHTSQRHNNPTFPIAAIEFRGFGAAIFDEPAPGAFGAVGGADVGPSGGGVGCVVGRKRVGGSWIDVDDLEQAPTVS